MEIRSNVPMTIVCSKATEDIKNLLENVMREHDMSADLMCMILRDASSYFERMRANDYTNAIIQQMGTIEQQSTLNEQLKSENEALKKTIQLFENLEGQNDNTKS